MTTFNYKKMQTHMKNLDANFAYFADTLKKANDMVNDFVSVSPSSSIYGEKAKKILNLWNQNASTFGDFYQNFESWSALLVNASNEYHKLEKSVFLSNRTTGATADGVTKSREQIKGISSTSNGIFTLPDGSTIQSLKDEMGETYAILKKNGVTIKRFFQEDGSYLDYDLEGNLLTPVTEEEETFITMAPTNNDIVTISSGQAVILNNEKCYFLVRNWNGIDYYVKTTDADAPVYMADEHGNLTFAPDPSYSSKGEFLSREDFVDKIKTFGGYSWNITYDNAPTPYKAVGTQIDPSFTENVVNPDYTNFVYDQGYLEEKAVDLEKLNYAISTRNDNFPDVVYLAPRQSIKYDVHWNVATNMIDGGEHGTYFVYNPEMRAYFKIAENGTYDSRCGVKEEREWWMPIEQLLSDKTIINK